MNDKAFSQVLQNRSEQKAIQQAIIRDSRINYKPPSANSWNLLHDLLNEGAIRSIGRATGSIVANDLAGPFSALFDLVNPSPVNGNTRHPTNGAKEERFIALQKQNLDIARQAVGHPTPHQSIPYPKRNTPRWFNF